MKKLFLLIFFAVTPFWALATHRTTDKDSAAHYLQMGATEEAARKYNAAWLYYDKATQFDPSNVEAWLRMADVCFLIRKNKCGIDALEAVRDLRPQDYALQWKLIRIYYGYDQYAKVVALLPSLREHVSATPGWLFMLGKSYYTLSNPDYDKAMEYLKRSLKKEGPNAEAAYLIARMQVKMENYAAAVPFFELSLSLDTIPQPTHMYDLALVLYTAGKPHEAIPYFIKARKNGYPQTDSYARNFATTLADAQQPGEAIAILEKLLARREKDLGIIRMIADISYISGHYQKAIDFYDRLLEIDPDNARVVYQIGSCYVKLGKEKDGKTLFKKGD